jgi:hypothetical protein
MTRVVVGAAVAIWGAAVLVTKVLHVGAFSTYHGGYYGVGQLFGLFVASLMVVVGAYHLRKGLTERGRTPESHRSPAQPPQLGLAGGAHEGSLPPPGRRS